MMTGLRLLSASLVACVASTCWVSDSARAAIYAPGDSIPNVQGDVFTWSRGDADGSYTGWVSFSGDDLTGFPATLTPNAAGQFGGESSLQLNTPGPFVTSGGNLYSPAVVQDFTATVRSGASGGPFTRVVAQFRTLGTELAYDSLRLSNDLGSSGSIAPEAILKSDRIDLGGFGGSQLDVLAVWNLESSQDAYRLDFNASGSSLSLSKFHLDTFTQSTAFASVTAVPEPASWLAIGAVTISGIGVRRFRRRARVTAA